jgi:hypothetical protein
MNINSEDYQYKFGSLIQFGTSYMQGFSVFADQFLLEYNAQQVELNEYGYSQSWINWQKQNSQQIVDLYDALNAENLIPTAPVSE